LTMVGPIDPSGDVEEQARQDEALPNVHAHSKGFSEHGMGDQRASYWLQARIERSEIVDAERARWMKADAPMERMTVVAA